MTHSPRPAGRLVPRIVTDVLVACAFAVLGALWLGWLEQAGTQGQLSPVAVLDGLPVTGFLLPLLVLAVPTVLARHRSAGRGDDRGPGRHRAADTDPSSALVLVTLQLAMTAALAAAAGNGIRATFFDTGSGGLPVVGLLADTASLLVAYLPFAAAVLLLPQLPRLLRLALHRPARSRRAVAGLAVAAVAVATAAATSVPASAAPSPGSVSCFAGGAADKVFDVTAMDVDTPLNRFGDHDPKGKIYTLTSQVAAVKAQALSQKVSVGLHGDAIQPLVIRANEGDCVQVRYTNQSSTGSYGFHVDGLEFTIASSGNTLGANPTATVPKGASRTYRFSVPDDPREEGGHYIHPGPGFRAAVNHGLFGALVVEPKGSTYWDPTTAGLPLASGWEAIIKPSGTDAACEPSSTMPTCGFREAALLHHEIGNDNELLKNKLGVDIPLVDDTTGSYRPGAFALNYRSEPFRNRLLAFPREKSHSYSSYTFGEPATPMMRGYLADPTKIRLMHVGAEKFHVFHLHGGGDRWRANPVADDAMSYARTGLYKDPETGSQSQRLDSQSIGPGESYNLEIEGGAGGVQQSTGDFLFHCHIAKHYTSGMWGLWRVFDTLQPDLVPLGDRPAPPAAVDSAGLLGRTFHGTTLTKDNLDDWIRPQLPPSGIPQGGQDPTVWDWKVAGTPTAPVYLGAPADPTVFPDSVQVVQGQPNLLAVDVGHLVGSRPAILFNPLNGRPAYPLLRTNIGKRPPFTPAGHSGAPWLGANNYQASTDSTDPWGGRDDALCPQNRQLRTYNVVAIGKTIPRSPTVNDPDGKLFVLAKDKAATLADPTRSDPLAIRANTGDCVAITLTNEIPDASAFDKFSKASMHIHHVQFDVQGSDGVSAGFAYEHSVRPYTVTDPKLVVAAHEGDTVLSLSSVAKFNGTDANGLPSHPWLAVGEGLESIEVHQVASVDTAAGTVTLTSPLRSDHASAESAGTEFIQYRWYPDVTLDNVFWHDHVDGIHGWGHGLVGQLIVEPSGSTYHDPVTGAEVDSGTVVDIHTSNPLVPGVVDGSFRELVLWTINDNDASGWSTLNLRANPLSARLDKANQFSSWKYGDPVTPLPRMYPGDPLVVRSISVSPTVDSLHFVGGRTTQEVRETRASIVDTVHAGVSERDSLVIGGTDPALALPAGDYLYANGTELRTQQGAWGIVRVLPGRVGSLRPLPGNTPATEYTEPTSTGAAPPPTTSPGNPCPLGAPTRQFDLSAMDRSGNVSGGRTAYVPNEDVASIKARLKVPVPLVMHVVAGECVTVHLTNLLGSPVGFAVGKMHREAGSGGVNVGFSTDQNTAPNATRSYVYYVPEHRVGSAVVSDLASNGRLKNGLYGVMVVAPASQVPGLSTEFSDPVTGEAKSLGGQVIVHVPGGSPQDYRDFTVTVADNDAQIGQDFMPYPTSATAGRSNISYLAAPVGDGATSFRNPGKVPYLTAFAGDPEVVHVLMAPGSENNHVFSLGGFRWEQEPLVGRSPWLTAQGMAPWETYDLNVVGGAGGTAEVPGDYFYGDLRRPFTAVGIWGLQRVLSPSTATCPILLVDGSTC
ncbi:multicopper oxidase domain-containing protein [Pedococcus sp. KACC 23699]|uniref:Multicopper oxidase domain-containing protein n=1 Tax=Pedococcus sp. KACC 23699 TaxID=3149228 RepID=A0AAU7JTL1_9MICO